MGLPTLDFAKFSSVVSSERKDLACRMIESFKRHGAVRLINHGIPAEVFSSVFQLSQRFFQIPLDARSRIPNSRDDTPQRGWSFEGSEKTSKLNMTDENGNVPIDLADKKVIGDDREFPNKWPMEAEIPNFQTAMNEFIELCHQIGLRVLEAMDVALELPSGTLSARCENPVTEARLNYYAPVSKASLAEDKGQRAWAHTDFGLITLLVQDAAGGLEIEDREKPGTFIPIIREDPTEIAVYISDTMESLTNGFLRAALHQVAVPVGMNDDETGVLPERYSVASFIKASRDTSAGPLPQFVDSDHPAKFKGMTAMELHRKRVRQLYVD